MFEKVNPCHPDKVADSEQARRKNIVSQIKTFCHVTDDIED